MIEIGVTITGADDEVDPVMLDEIAREYPFVEWAILFSQSREGQPRYPTASWREKFYWATFNRGQYYSTAAHLCGKSVDAFLASYEYFKNEVTMGFDAIQINKLTDENRDEIFTFARTVEDEQDIILQFNDNTSHLLTGWYADEIPENLRILFDASGGKGKSAQETGGWPNIPEPFSSNLAYGYAGGINESNIEQVMFEVQQLHKDVEGWTWVDLETGARTEDKFDIDKVIRILELAKKSRGD